MYYGNIDIVSLVDEDRKPEEWSEGCFMDIYEESGCGTENGKFLGEVTINS